MLSYRSQLHVGPVELDERMDCYRSRAEGVPDFVSDRRYLQAKDYLSTRDPATLSSSHLDVDHMLLDDIIASCNDCMSNSSTGRLVAPGRHEWTVQTI